MTALVAFSTTIAAQLPDYVPPSQLDAWFALDGDGVDESGNGNQVEALGATLDTDRFGNPSSCFLLDGDGDYLTFGSSLGNVQDFTAAYWMETTETTGYNLLLNKDCDGCEYSTGDWGFITSNGNSGILSFSLSNSNGGFYEDIGFVADGDWHHVVVTRNATTGAVHFYLDGESVEEHLGPTGSVTNGNALHFGLQQPYNPAYYEGRVDDLGMWSRVLSGEEILGLYQSAPPVFGCIDSSACNFMPEANLDDGSCIDCALFEERCGPGTMWDETAQLCVVANPSDTDFDGCVSMTDLLDLLTVFGTCNEVPWSCGDPLEYQGYDYETVQIGEQCWFAENLRATSYQNGNAIPTGSSLADWDEANGQGYQVAYGGLPAAICEDFSTTIDACDPAQSLDTYGLLYNNFVVTDARGICPQGWHVGTDEDWGEFEVFLGMDETIVFTEGFRGTNQGTMIKTTTGWQNNGSGTDDVGFHGHPSGGIAPDQDRFGNGGSDAVWWTPSEINGLDRRRSMNDYNDGIRRATLPPTSGAAIRCIKDSE